ncbi:MAG: outer membrane protein assembly factor BamD [Deltaproteobacteria bacterium]|nr:outer membrane protein assembly factor BamD [Deltaproteobacteria bacterium]
MSQPPAAVAASHLLPPPGAAPTTAALPVESATVVAPDPTLVSPAKATPPPAPAKAAPAASSAAPALSHEIQLIDAARQAIEAGDPTSAIAALDRYQRECPTGVLALEAQVLRIEAIARSGDPAGAAQLARRFLEGHPDSPYEARVRKHLPGEP